MYDVLIFFLKCLVFSAAAIMAIVSLYLTFEHLLPFLLKKQQKDYAKAKDVQRFRALESLNGPLMVHLKNNTQFSAQEVADMLPGEQEGYEDLVIFVTASGKKKYVLFKAIDLVEESANKTP